MIDEEDEISGSETCENCPYVRAYQERRHLTLSEEQVAIIAGQAAKAAAEMVKNDFYLQVGKSVVSKALLIIGAVATGVYIAWREGWRP